MYKHSVTVTIIIAEQSGCLLGFYMPIMNRQAALLGNLSSCDGNCNENVTLKLNFALSLLRLFHVDHVVQNRRSALSLAWYEYSTDVILCL